MTLAETQPLTIAATSLLLSARSSATRWHSCDSLDQLLHHEHRYSHSGPGSTAVTPQQAFAELLAFGYVQGSTDRWCLT